MPVLLLWGLSYCWGTAGQLSSVIFSHRSIGRHGLAIVDVSSSILSGINSLVGWAVCCPVVLPARCADLLVRGAEVGYNPICCM